MNLPGLFKNEHAQNAHRAKTGHHEKHIHKRPIVGLLEQRVIKQIARPRQGVGRTETLLEQFLQRYPIFAGIAGFNGDNCPTIMD